MSIESVRENLAAKGLADRILEFEESSATVAEAARDLGCEPARILKMTPGRLCATIHSAKRTGSGHGGRKTAACPAVLPGRRPFARLAGGEAGEK